ncbi:MAG: hypothetical protein V3V14_08495 [Saprospiraceae bacterium]
MKKLLFFAITINLLILSSCKTDSGSKDSSNAKNSTLPKTSKVNNKSSNLQLIYNMGKMKPNEITKMRTTAKGILNLRWKESNKKAWIIIDKDLWEYEFIFSGREMSKPNQMVGHWIDFDKDLTYTYGKYDKELGSGQYTLETNQMTLLMIDDNENVKPMEMEAKLQDATFIMAGSNIYKDNNFQAKLKRISSRPIES